MSLVDRQIVPCPCGAPIEMPLARTINASRHPQLRELVLSRQLHRFTCAACERVLRVDQALCYIDWERHQLFFVAPRADLHRVDEKVAETIACYQSAFAVGPLQQEGSTFMVRLCFGYEELREKLLIADAGLDDLVIEALKCDVLGSDPCFAAAGVITLRFDREREGGREGEEAGERDDGREREDGRERDAAPALARDGRTLVFYVERALPRTDGAVEEVEVAHELYQRIEAGYDRIGSERPGLSDGPHVSLLRLAHWPAPASAPAPRQPSLL